MFSSCPSSQLERLAKAKLFRPAIDLNNSWKTHLLDSSSVSILAFAQTKKKWIGKFVERGRSQFSNI